jgi:hypothetical protein
MVYMSKTTNPDPILRFLNRLAVRNGWVHPDTPALNVAAGYGRDGSISLNAVKVVQKHKIFIDIVLNPHKTLPCYIVQQFAVNGENCIDEATILNHYGKRYGTINDTRNTDLRDLWTVGCARDLEALMRAHDSLTKFFGSSTVFDLP